MGKIELLHQAINDAKQGRSKLPETVLQLPSFCTAKIKHLLNNIASFNKQYLEVGLHKAGTFVSALYGNDCFGTGIDDWSQFEQNGESKKLAYEATEAHLKNSRYKIYDMDCFKINLLYGITDFFFYDGEHSTENQKKALTYFYPNMKNEFIYAVDDASWEGPREGTKQAIEELKLNVLFSELLWDGREGGEWHNGIAVYLFQKK